MSTLPPTSLCQALSIGPESLVSLVGGGGKTTLMYGLLKELNAQGVSCAGATTTKIAPPTPEDGAELVLGETFEELASNLKKPRTQIPVAGKSLMEGPKVVGIPPHWCDRIISEKLAGTLIVEADGSRRLPLKAPGENEPVIPSRTTNFIVLIGLSCLGKPLGPASVFRHELAAALTGTKIGDPIDVEILARLLTVQGGLTKGLPEQSAAMIFLNQADTPELLMQAEEIAKLVLALPSPFKTVVAGRLNTSKKVEALWLR